MDSDTTNNWEQVNEHGPLEFHENAVSGLNHCQSANASKLILTDIAYRLNNNDYYDIGGTYTNEEPDLWFYYTTSEFMPDNCILNLFVKHRKSGTFSIGISEICSNEMSFENENKSGNAYSDLCPKYTFLPKSMTWKMLISPLDNVSHHIMSYSFTKTVVNSLEGKILCIPVKIEINPHKPVKSALQEIRKNHLDINTNIKHSKPDIILESSSSKQYPMHKIFLATHSPVFRELMKNKNTNVISLDIKDEHIEPLLEFFYTGTIENIKNKNFSDIQEIANKFEINNLKILIIKTLSESITIENAIDLVILSDKYKLEALQENILKFISQNKVEIMKTDGWKNLNDAEIAKKMFKAFSEFW